MIYFKFSHCGNFVVNDIEYHNNMKIIFFMTTQYACFLFINIKVLYFKKYKFYWNLKPIFKKMLLI